MFLPCHNYFVMKETVFIKKTETIDNIYRIAVFETSEMAIFRAKIHLS